MQCDICGSSINEKAEKKYHHLFEEDFSCFCEIINLLAVKDKKIKELDLQLREQKNR